MAEQKKKRRRRRKEWKFEDFKYILNLSERLAQYLRLLLQLDVATWTFALDKIRQGTAYKEWSKSKGPGKGRRFFAAPCEELKLVQRAIDQRFLTMIPVHFSRHGNRLGSSIVTNAEHHAGFAKSVFTVDIVNAFPSVYRSRLKANLHKPFVFALRQFQGTEFLDEDVELMLQALVDLVCLHDRLPQGPPTSPRLFNLVCLKMDKDIWELLSTHSTPFQSYRYTAYADNLTISSNGEIPEELRESVIAKIRQNGFYPHTSKDKMKFMSPETGEVPVVTGIVINADGRLTMAPNKVNQLRARLHQAVKLADWDREVMERVSGTLAYIRYLYPRRSPSKLRVLVETAELRLQEMRIAAAKERKAELRLPKATCANMLFTDGASRGNPGPASAGIVLLRNGADEKVFSTRLGTATNNQAEYWALLHGLEAAVKAEMTELDCFLDNELIVKQLNKECAVRSKHLRSLYARVLELVSQIGVVRFQHIAREQNVRADALANQALDQHEQAEESAKEPPASSKHARRKGKKQTAGKRTKTKEVVKDVSPDMSISAAAVG